MFSIHFTGCLPWFLLPVIEQCISFTGSRSLPILETCPNHVNLRCAILSTNVLSWCRMLHTVSFILSRLLGTQQSSQPGHFCYAVDTSGQLSLAIPLWVGAMNNSESWDVTGTPRDVLGPYPWSGSEAGVWLRAKETEISAAHVARDNVFTRDSRNCYSAS